MSTYTPERIAELRELFSVAGNYSAQYLLARGWTLVREGDVATYALFQNKALWTTTLDLENAAYIQERHEAAEALTEIERLQSELSKRDAMLHAADRVMVLLDEWIRDGRIGSRNPLADARIDYSMPEETEVKLNAELTTAKAEGFREAMEAVARTYDERAEDAELRAQSDSDLDRRIFTHMAKTNRREAAKFRALFPSEKLVCKTCGSPKCNEAGECASCSY